jgi:hypothetical protein
LTTGRIAFTFPILLAAAAWSGVARSQEREVPLPAANLLAGWCVAPRCPGGAPLLTRPAPLTSDEERGLLEQTLRRSLVDALQAELATWGDRGSRDVLRALVRELGAEGSRRGQELASAVLRAGISQAVAQVATAEPTCRGDSRLDAAYEGLALSVVGQLGFTEARGTVSPACVPVAARAQAIGNAGVLAAIAGPMTRDLVALDRSLSEARTRCTAGTPGVSAGATSLLDALSRAPARPSLAQSLRLLEQIRQAQAEVTASAAALGTACAASLGAAGGLSTTGIQGLSAKGLDGVALRELVESLESGAANASAAGSEGASAAREIRATIGALARGGVTRQTLAELARNLGPDQEATGLAAVALRSLESAVVDGTSGPTLDPTIVAQALDRRFELKEGKLSPRALLGLDNSLWIFELNGGIPQLGSGPTRIVGDTRLGYEGTSFGAVVQGGVRYFDLSGNGVSTENLDAHGSLDAWWRSGDSQDRARFELRLTGGVQYLDATTIDAPPGTSKLTFGDYDSMLLQGGLLLGVRLRPAERLTLALRAGGGFQYETHDSTSLQAGRITLDSPDTISLQGLAQLRLRWRLMPSILALRLEGDGAYFRVSRDDFSFSSTGGVQQSLTLTEQLSMQGRLFVDLDLLSLGGFVPSVFGSLESTIVSGLQTTQTTTVPIVGLGLGRPTF